MSTGGLAYQVEGCHVNCRVTMSTGDLAYSLEGLVHDQQRHYLVVQVLLPQVHTGYAAQDADPSCGYP